MESSSDKKRLLSNFVSLSVLQGLNMILPLLTLPYLVRVLGVENFGLVNFSLSIIMYFNILVSFGFELSATREISLHRDNLEKVSEIFSTVMLIKALLLFVSFMILSFLLFFNETFNANIELYYITFLLVLGNFLFPSWFFQGMERMEYITYINLIFRILFTVLIFIFVKDESDYLLVPLLNSLGVLFSGIYSLKIISQKFNIKWASPSKEMLIKRFKESYLFFFSRVANNGSRFYATTVIGLTFGNVAVGYYSMVEKLYYAFMSLVGVVSQTIYPYMSRTKNIEFFKKILLLISVSSVIVFTVLMIYHQEFLSLIFNIENKMLSDLFIIVFIGTIFGVISTMIGYPLLASLGYINHANNSLIYASIVYIVYITLATFTNNIYYVAFSVVVYAFFSFLFRVYYVFKTKLLHIKK